MTSPKHCRSNNASGESNSIVSFLLDLTLYHLLREIHVHSAFITFLDQINHQQKKKEIEIECDAVAVTL